MHFVSVHIAVLMSAKYMRSKRFLLFAVRDCKNDGEANVCLARRACLPHIKILQQETRCPHPPTRQPGSDAACSAHRASATRRRPGARGTSGNKVAGPLRDVRVVRNSCSSHSSTGCSPVGRAVAAALAIQCASGKENSFAHSSPAPDWEFESRSDASAGERQTEAQRRCRTGSTTGVRR